MEAVEMLSTMPSRNRKREWFLFNRIENVILREETDRSSVGIPSKWFTCWDGMCQSIESDEGKDVPTGNVSAIPSSHSQKSQR